MIDIISLQLLLYFIIILAFWLLAARIVITEVEKKSVLKPDIIENVEVVLVSYTKGFFKGSNKIVGRTHWGTLCTVNDKEGKFEDLVNAHIGGRVKIYYMAIPAGLLFFHLSNDTTSIIILE